MNLELFNYDLLENLIAQKWLEKRDHSRLLILDKKNQEIKEEIFYNILSYLTTNDVLVINTSKVIKARLFWEIDIFPKWKKQIKPVEIFLHSNINENTWECLWYPWKNLKIWREIRFFDENKNIVLTWTILNISQMWRYIEFDKSWVELINTINQIWNIPLPPYITEKLENFDRYQTIYSKQSWSVRAPTAWLHFTPELIEKIKQKWIIIEEVLLHVWVGTFKWVETENITKHYMHKEFISLSEETSKRLTQYKKDWKNIIAVWTTSVRVLESFANWKNNLSYWTKYSDIFIYPGYEWKIVDWLITNFHLPKSTLLMLVCSFGWYDFIMLAYYYAIKNNFRFFSFWDAMFIR